MKVNLKAIALVCSLKPSPAQSSSELLASHVLREMKRYAVESEVIRIADKKILSGVEIDMGEGDEWPDIREKIMQADILLISTPIWMGHPSSYAQRVVERLDAELGETDDQGRLLTYGKVGIVAIVGNEDGAHKVCADMFQALNDVGFTIPAAGSTYWVGEAMQKTDFKDLSHVPNNVDQATKAVACNAAHLARMLRHEHYPSLT